MRRAAHSDTSVLPRVPGTVDAAGPLRLRKTDVDLWRVSLDEPSGETVGFLSQLLSADEEERAGRFCFDRDRRRFVVGRGVLRLLLGRYLGCPAVEIAFRYGANGKPALAAAAREPLAFNLAHSEGLALYAFTRTGEVGIDLERLRDLPDWEYIAATCFPLADQARVHAAAPEDRRLEFFRAWTRQEALLKATGAGIGSVDSAAPLPAKIPYDDGLNPMLPGRRRPAIDVYPLYLADGYAAALAVAGAPRWITCHTWDESQLFARGRMPRRTRRLPLVPTAESGIALP